MSRLVSFLFLISLLAACQPESSDEPAISYDGTRYNLEYGNLPDPVIPADNPLTVEGVKLGRMLFYEKDLSKDGTMSCASCHRIEDAFTDTARFSLGVRGLPGGRQAMPVFNMLWHENEFFWDGRAHLLRDQSLMPIQDELEMDETLPSVENKLKALQLYVDQFKRAFPDGAINSLNMSLAMEQFMNSIVSYQSKFDRVQAGLDTFTRSERRGRRLYFQEYNQFFPDSSGADCAHCHGGPNFENDRYMNNGLDEDASFTDTGREKVTMNPRDRAKFKVPSLRNIELTPPYMHDGRFQTLEEVIEHYNSGVKFSSTVDPTIENTRMTGLFLDSTEKADLKAFLLTLTDRKLIVQENLKDPFN